MSRPPVFLAHGRYRRRRLQDASRLLPVVGAVLTMLPLLRGEAARSTSWGLIYLFAVWAVLIAAAACLSRALRRGDEPGEHDNAA